MELVCAAWDLEVGVTLVLYLCRAGEGRIFFRLGIDRVEGVAVLVSWGSFGTLASCRR